MAAASAASAPSKPADAVVAGAPMGSAAPLPQVAPLSKYKMCFLGDQGVGKTSIIRVFVKGSFSADYKATIGVDFLSKTLYLESRTVRLQIWDTAGQERFRALAPSYIRDSQVAVVVYDISSRASFLNVAQWVADVRAVQGSDAIVALIGNKQDLGTERQVSTEEGEARGKELGVRVFLETSARDGRNVKALFQRLASALPSEAAAPAPADSNLIDVRLSSKPPAAKDESSTCGC